MKTLSWNVRSCNAPDKIRLIKRCLDQSKPDLVLLQEIKTKEEDFQAFKDKFRRWECLLSGAQGASRGMAILWKPKILKVTDFILDSNLQWFRINVKQLHCSFLVFNIYGPNNSIQKRLLWKTLSKKVQRLENEMAILGGDFNAILNPGDKKKGKGWISES